MRALAYILLTYATAFCFLCGIGALQAYDGNASMQLWLNSPSFVAGLAAAYVCLFAAVIIFLSTSRSRQ